MEAAKAAVSKFTSNRGHHTTVEENVAPHVTSETVKPHRHEEHTQATDREVHQHHYHTTVQPLQHKERLPEQHTHQMMPTEHREFHHDNEEETQRKVAADLGKFKDSSVTHETRHTRETAPSVTGEHVHHHVHESVVPVVHKETIQPEVVHTTVPVHETHHAAAQHHGLSALPMKTLDEFKQAGGTLTGGSKGTHEEYEGQPRKYNDKMSTTFEKLGLSHGQHGTETSGHRHADSGVGGVGSTGGVGGLENKYDQRSAGTTGGSNYNTGSTGMGSSNYSNSNTLDGNTGTSHGQHGLSSSNAGVGGTTAHSAESGDLNQTRSKPSLMDRLNPKKDADGDGKAGMMS